MTTNAWTRNSGSLQGRIQPTGWQPAGGDYVLCLGSDVEGDVQALAGGDNVAFGQTAGLGTDATVRFRARTRGPTEIPKTVVVGATTDGTWDILIDSVSHQFVASTNTVVEIAHGLAAAVNDGDSGVVARVVGDGSQVQLNGLDESVLAVSGPGTIEIATFIWWALMLIDGTVRFSQTILPGFERDRADGGACIRVEMDAGGTHEVKFQLELESSVTGAAVELELPAYYVDSVIFEAAP